jgi:type II secretory pathway component PulJ
MIELLIALYLTAFVLIGIFMYMIANAIKLDASLHEEKLSAKIKLTLETVVNSTPISCIAAEC